MRSQMLHDAYSAVQNMRCGQFPPLLGVVSCLGIIVWAVARAVPGFMALVMLQRRAIQLGLFLLSQSAITGILVADDLVLMHEMVFPRFSIDEKVAFAVYICLVDLWVTRFRGVISFIGPSLLILSGVGFACRLCGDLLESTPYTIPLLDAQGSSLGSSTGRLSRFGRAGSCCTPSLHRRPQRTARGGDLNHGGPNLPVCAAERLRAIPDRY